jgi:electron transfer flavoprotein beta subunit
MLKIVVCVKQVYDPEVPVSRFQVSARGRRVVPPQGTPPVLSPFDENALEVAFGIKDAMDARITVISMGAKISRPLFRAVTAAGADELILLEDSRFEELDSYASAHVLAYAIGKIGGCDLVLCGRQAADTDAGQVGIGIAEILDIPAVTFADKVEADGVRLRVTRLNGSETVESAMPALVTMSNIVGELRRPPVSAFLDAKKHPPTVWKKKDIAFDPTLRRTVLHKLFIPEWGGTDCQMIEGKNPAETAGQLASVIAAGMAG